MDKTTKHNIAQLQQLFPEVFTGDTIDWVKFKVVFGASVTSEKERYNFTWTGKTNAIQEALKPSTATLKAYPKESINFDKTQNLYIEGDNLDVLKLIQEEYKQKIDLIYIDPPYNTGKDFVYNDNFKIKTAKKTNHNELSDAHHANWLNMLYPRLVLARNLLTDSGFIFISIDDNELQNLTMICNEIFGESNFIANVVRRRRKSQANLSKNIATIHEYVLVYAKSNKAILNKLKTGIDASKYKNPDKDKRGAYVSMPCTNKGGAKYSITTPTGNVIAEEWRFKRSTYDALLADNRIVFPRGGAGKPRYKLFLKEKLEAGVIPNSWWSDISSNQEASRELKKLFDDVVLFEHPKPVDLIKRIIALATDKNAIILDFFAGSSTTAHAVLELNAEENANRKFIQIQKPELTHKKSNAYKSGYKTITAIGKERIKRVAKLIAQQEPKKVQKLDLGFKVYKISP